MTPNPRGRPKSADPASTRLIVRITPGRKAAYEDAADAAGVSLAEWTRSTLDAAEARAGKKRSTKARGKRR